VHKTWNVLSKQIPLTPGFFWSYLGRFLDHWRMAEQRFRFDVLMRGVLLLSFTWRARRNHARDQKRCPLFYGREGGCAIEPNITGLSLSACLACCRCKLLATGWVYAFGVSCLLLVAVADSCNWLLSCFGRFAHARTTGTSRTY
jgi:hypothetical protein